MKDKSIAIVDRLEKIFAAFFLFSLIVPLSHKVFQGEWSRIYFFDFWGVIILFLWFIRVLRPPKYYAFRFNILDYLMIAFLIWLFIADIIGANSPLSLGAWALLGRSFLIYLYVSKNVNNFLSLKHIIVILCLILSLEISLAFVQYLYGTNFGQVNSYFGVKENISNFGSNKFLRAPGTFINTNILAGWLAYGAIIMLSACIMMKDNDHRILPFSTIGFAALAALFITCSRVKIIAAFLGVVFLIWWNRHKIFSFEKKRKLYVYGSIFVVGFLFLSVMLMRYNFLPNFTNRFTQVLTLQSKSFERKALQRRLAFQLMLNHPITGVGQRNFDSMIDKKDYPYRNFKDGQLACHNIPLKIGAEAGIIGFVLFCSVFLYLLVQFFKQMRYQPVNMADAVKGGALICCAVMVFDMQFNNVLFHPSFMPLFFMLMGLAAMGVPHGKN